VRARLPLALLATLGLVLGLTLSAPTLALASDGYTERQSTTYTLNPAAERVDVVVDIDFKNTSRSTSTTEFYYTGVYFSLEHAATNIHADAGGDSTRLELQKRGTAFDEWFVHWEPVLFYGHSKHVHVTYQIPSGKPRSTSAVRVNPAYADFCVVAGGPDGGSTTVRVPAGYDLSVTGEGGSLVPTTSGGYTVYRTGTLADPYAFWSCLSGENPDGYSTATVSSPSGRRITIESWPDDADWSGQLNLQINPILIQLEQIVGEGLPGDAGIIVREVGNGTLGNYAGFFDPETSIARIGEDLDVNGLVAHELSHAWFNGKLFVDHWMSEGTAEWARITIAPDTCPEPTTYPGTGSPNLTRWQFAGPRATQQQLDIIDYQYKAACAIVSQVASKVGPDRWRAILHALLHHQLAYQSSGTVLPGLVGPATWKVWLDDVDELGLVPAGEADLDWATQLLTRYGIPDKDSSMLLAQRSAARKTYHALQASIGTWTIPVAILKPMGYWSFDVATNTMASATEIYSTAAQVKSLVPEADGTTGQVEKLFESAQQQSDLDAALTAAKDEVDAATSVKAARDAFSTPLDLVGQVGMFGVTLQPTVDAMVQAMVGGDLGTARTDAAQVQATLADVPHQGQVRIEIAVGIALGLLLLIMLLVVRRRRRRRVALALASATAGDVALGEAEPGPAIELADAAAAPPESTSDEPPTPS